MRKGRSQNLYKFSSVPGDATVGDEEVQTVLVSSFVIDDLFAGVRKRPGKESQPLLTADGGDYESSGSIDDTGNNMWGSLFGTKKAGSSLTAYPKDTIHVFSLASGTFLTDNLSFQFLLFLIAQAIFTNVFCAS